jgi:hypothetical protein
MRFRVKPHSGILSVFLSTRGPSALAIGPLAGASLLRLPWHSFSPAALPSPGRGGARRGRKNARLGARFHARLGAGKCPRVGWRRARPGQYARTTVYPCDACHGATTPYLVRTKRTGRPIQSPPIERTVPLQVTRRQNGDSLRLAVPASSAALTLRSFLRSSGSQRATHTAAACFA